MMLFDINISYYDILIIALYLIYVNRQVCLKEGKFKNLHFFGRIMSKKTVCALTLKNNRVIIKKNIFREVRL